MKNYLRKTVLFGLCFCMALSAAFVANPIKSEAGQIKGILTWNKTVSKKECDINGDGKMDIISIKTKMDEWDYYIERCSLYINGKKAFSMKNVNCLDVEARFVAVTKKERYIQLTGYSENGYVEFSYLLKYQSGQLKKVKSFTVGTHRRDVVAISKKNLIIACQEQLALTGYIEYRVKYTKKAGKWVKATKTYPVKDSSWNGDGNCMYTSKKKVRLYKNRSCKGDYYVINAGKKFKLLKIRHGNDTTYGYFKCGKKYGWINIDNYNNYGTFKNVMLAG